VSPILEDIISHVDDPRSPGNRYTDMTPLWTFELLHACGNKVIDMVRDQFSVPSRQALFQKPLSNYVRSDLTDFRWESSGFGHGTPICAEKSATSTVRDAF
jgi:hypothetical protein